jgi:hypothetical protein
MFVDSTHMSAVFVKSQYVLVATIPLYGEKRIFWWLIPECLFYSIRMYGKLYHETVLINIDQYG